VTTSTPEKIILADHKSKLKTYDKSLRRKEIKYHCPACQGHNLSFHEDGRWNCWNNPSREHRLEILDALFPDRDRGTIESAPEIFIPKPEEDLNLYEHIPNIPGLKIGYPSIGMEPVFKKAGKATRYHYSESQRIDRIDYPSHKVFCPKHKQLNDWIKGAGKLSWPPYGLQSIIPISGFYNLVLVVEGQKSVLISRSRNIPAICLEGGDYNDRTRIDKISSIASHLVKPLLVILPDNDLSGKLKAAKALRCCIQLNIPALLLNPADMGYESPGDDIEQIDLDRFTLMARVLKTLNSTKATRSRRSLCI
jgi:hypothetical protein